MTIYLDYFAELRDLQILRAGISDAGPADLQDMQRQIDVWHSEDGTDRAVNSGVRSIAITNGGVDTKIGRVLVIGFNTAYFSSGFGRQVIEELYFDTAGRGIEMTKSADDALVRSCYSNAFWSGNIAGQRNDHGDFGARPGIAFDFHDQCDGLRCVDCTAIGWATGFRLSNVWAVTLLSPGAEPARQPAGRVTRGIFAENCVSHTSILNPLIDGFMYKLDLQHRPSSKTPHTGVDGRPGPAQYPSASVTISGGSLQGNSTDPANHRAIRLGPYSSGVVIATNLAGFLERAAILVEKHAGTWKFIGISPSNAVRQPLFEFAAKADQPRILRLGCDPINDAAPPQLSMAGLLVLPELPTSPAGLPPGALWRDGKSVKIA